MTGKKYLLPIIFLSFLLAIFPIYRRWQVEVQNKSVELVLDGHGLIKLAAIVGDSPQGIIKKLALDSVTLQPLTPKMMAERGGMRVKPLKISSRLGLPPFQPLEGTKEKVTAYHVEIENPFLIDFFLDNLPSSYTALELSRTGDYLVVKGNAPGLPSLWEQDLLQAPLDFFYYDWAVFKETGVNIVLRPQVGQGKNSLSLSEILAGNMENRELIFAGNNIWGDPGHLKETGEIIKSEELVWGFVEPFLAQQKGARELGHIIPEQVARVHSIQQREINILPPSRVVSRYLRAVIERNARILYLRPILQGESSEEILQKNNDLLEDLRGNLIKKGYSIGKPGLYPELQLKMVELLVLYLGLLAAFCLFCNYYRNLPFLLNIAIILGGLVLAILFIILGQKALLIRLSSLAIALLAPLLPIMMVLRKSQLPRFSWLMITGGTLMGSAFLAAFASDRLFILGLDYFQGVKVALIAPLLLLLLFIYYEKAGTFKEFTKGGLVFLKSLWRWPVLLTLCFLALAVVLYITRSGNYPILPVPAWEIALRESLERIFLIRPRFKEVFWGHPLLIVGLYLWKENKWPWLSSLLICLGAMGQITIVNSFTHFHTPLWVSLWRSLIGMITGGILGYGAIFLGKVLGIWEERA